MKQKTNKSVSKRFFKTKGWKWKVMRAKAAHNHRLIPKTKERKVEGKKSQSVSASDVKKMKHLFSLI